MSKHLIIALLLFRLFHHGFAGAHMGPPKATNAMLQYHTEVTDAIMKKHTEALRTERWKFEHLEDVDQKVLDLKGVITRAYSNYDARVVVPLIIDHIMKPVDPSFPSVDITNPAAEMSHAELEFRCEVLDLTALFSKIIHCQAMASILIVREALWQEMRERVHDAMFTPSPAIHYSPYRPIDWTSIILAAMSEILRAAKALHLLQDPSCYPVSSFLECDVLLAERDTLAKNLHQICRYSESLEHLFYNMLYYKMVAQRKQFIVIACLRFLEERQKLGSPSDQVWIDKIQKRIARKAQCMETFRRKFFDQKEILSVSYGEMAETFYSHLEHLTSEIAKLKEEIAVKDYHSRVDSVSKVRKIVEVTRRPLDFLLEGVCLPFEATLLFELLPGETSPALVLMAEYHLLFLWRCMQELSLLQWFETSYHITMNYGFTIAQVNGAMTKIADKAEYALSVFDAYKEATGGPGGQSNTPRISDEERGECLKLIFQGRNHLVDTWEDILKQNVDDYITFVGKAIADVENFYVPTDVDLLDYIQHVDGIPPQVHHLISAYPVPENLQPSYLKLATRLHRLVVDRLYKAATSSKLWNYLQLRSQVFAAYEDAARAVGLGTLPDMRGYSLGQVGSSSTLAARDQVSPNTGSASNCLTGHGRKHVVSAPTAFDAQGGILDPATSIHSGPYDSIEYGLGTQSRAVSEDGSRAGRRQNRRNRHAGGRSDVGPSGGFEHLE
ncbi:hypothetical protein SeLEV6574_g05611 [Synchytrium endobioticum]|uniref:Uncharacterized protein n=1 Tax=Synchytrium endobioticum TaxID=286115 RepID=A0A507CTJ5_9FUNG|nr:hypothetical protein SeLEV6574_g05611 [Synchytrium endobioticum]